MIENLKSESGVDSIYAIDVVNEAINWSNDANAWTHRTQPTDEGAWYSRMNDYIEKAFTYARQYAPEAKLFYNDFMMEKYPGKQTAVKDLVQGLLDNNVPIDGVGFQMHYRVEWALTRADFAQLFKDYGDMGLEVHVTELDIELCARDNGVATVCDPT